jgi:hypothetical protein
VEYALWKSVSESSVAPLAAGVTAGTVGVNALGDVGLVADNDAPEDILRTPFGASTVELL